MEHISHLNLYLSVIFLSLLEIADCIVKSHLGAGRAGGLAATAPRGGIGGGETEAVFPLIEGGCDKLVRADLGGTTGGGEGASFSDAVAGPLPAVPLPAAIPCPAAAPSPFSIRIVAACEKSNFDGGSALAPKGLVATSGDSECGRFVAAGFAPVGETAKPPAADRLVADDDETGGN